MEKRMGLPSFIERATCIDIHSSSPKTKSRASEASSLFAMIEVSKSFATECRNIQREKYQ